MNEMLLELIQKDMKPALGVTEPAAIALACAAARALTEEPVERLLVKENSGIYKNAFTCGIPGTDKIGNLYAAALGCVAGDKEKGLLVLEGISDGGVEEARRFIDEGRVKVEVSSISSELYIYACVKTEHDCCEVEIRDSHTNICRLVKNGRVILDKTERAWEAGPSGPATGSDSVTGRNPITRYTMRDFFLFAKEVPLEELYFIREAYRVNTELAGEALRSRACTLTKSLLAFNGDKEVSDNLRATARYFAGAASEARVLGLNKPAMSITGSGNHGIICTMPLYAMYRVEKQPEELLLRATALSYLVTMYMKEYSGKLSAFCGCGIAAGTGMACAMTFMRGGGYEAIVATLNNMAASIVGMICTGGNHACCMKVLAAVDTAVTSMELALSGSSVSPEHGVADVSPEKTMQNIGLIASPGMIRTEQVILDIMQKKNGGAVTDEKVD
ncbi:L-serine ammonia-lyase, iron-sulfur-dependent, subunit alpha [[Clostridium] symbiosum]|uniref:L-cysteine desulfidase family protein n=1 Tax=Clostridium symbiosum TaxID=1512 RepID=UPI001D06057B|nr:L-serine ammonia-lyase, iron-sulfur-dependent, subunit alpha [[Clostridium] symbiosum]MCB6611506.1 L-serine ammonia-lyase, iron-sulfur-dependent, subunit alpha [[Clostridium] symbiosum]MCB6933002.1 L-serine ammonia-lyase, iron-sulfur-dependent, subunit alpha [[Clostridium] symbiosum]